MEKTKKCKRCGNEFEIGMTICPVCHKKQGGTPTWLVIVCVIFGLLVLVGLMSDKTEEKDGKYKKNKDVEVVVEDFSTMTEYEIDRWCEENKINCNIKEEYSDTIEESKLISQSVEHGKKIYEGNSIEIVISLGREVSPEQKKALKKAESYSDRLHMSKKGIYEQLTSEYGEGFTAEEAQYAIDHVKADWKYNALQKAKSYSDLMNMSKSAIYEQLISEYGEGFTEEEAQYAIDHLYDE